MTHQRSGVVLYEVLAAFALLGVLIALIAEVQTATAAARRAAERRAVAMQAAANVAERSTAISWANWTDEGLAQAGLAATVAEVLPEATLKLSIVPSVSGPPAKRLDIEIAWPPASSTAEPPVRLSHWAFAPSGGPTP